MREFSLPIVSILCVSFLYEEKGRSREELNQEGAAGG